MNYKLLVALFTSMALIGCTSMRTIDSHRADFLDKLETGDHLVVYESTGRIVDMTLTNIDGDILVGSLSNSPLSTIEVDINDITRIEIERIDGLKTTGAVVGAIVLAPIAILGAAMAGY